MLPPRLSSGWWLTSLAVRVVLVVVHLLRSMSLEAPSINLIGSCSGGARAPSHASKVAAVATQIGENMEFYIGIEFIRGGCFEAAQRLLQ